MIIDVEKAWQSLLSNKAWMQHRKDIRGKSVSSRPHGKYLQRLEDFASEKSIKIKYKLFTDGDWGYWDPGTDTIVLKKLIGRGNQAVTLIHELAHYLFHYNNLNIPFELSHQGFYCLINGGHVNAAHQYMKKFINDHEYQETIAISVTYIVCQILGIPAENGCILEFKIHNITIDDIKKLESPIKLLSCHLLENLL